MAKDCWPGTLMSSHRNPLSSTLYTSDDTDSQAFRDDAPTSGAVGDPGATSTVERLPDTRIKTPSVITSGAPVSLVQGYSQVESFGPSEDYITDEEVDEEETVYVTLDLGNIEPTLVPSSMTYRLVGLEAPTPYLQLSGTIFKGSHNELLGTELLFRDDTSQDTQDWSKRTLTHVTNTSHRITFKEVRLTPKHKPPPQPHEGLHNLQHSHSSTLTLFPFTSPETIFMGSSSIFPSGSPPNLQHIGPTPSSTAKPKSKSKSKKSKDKGKQKEMLIEQPPQDMGAFIGAPGSQLFFDGMDIGYQPEMQSAEDSLFIGHSGFEGAYTFSEFDPDFHPDMDLGEGPSGSTHALHGLGGVDLDVDMYGT